MDQRQADHQKNIDSAVAEALDQAPWAQDQKNDWLQSDAYDSMNDASECGMYAW
jgi:hypothetical protein